MSRALPVTAIHERSKGEGIELGQTRVTHTQEFGALVMFFEATPEHVEGCGIIASTASSRPFIVGLW